LALVSVIALLTAYAVATDYFYFNDSAAFFFAMAADLAPEAVWRQFPKRLVALVLTQGPAMLWLQGGGGLTTARQIYASTFMLLPLLALALAWRLNPAREALQAWAVVVCVLTFATFGFPTETSVALSLLVVLLAAVTALEPSVLRSVVLLIVPPLFLLTHEVSLVTSPALVWVAYTQQRQGQLARPLWYGLLAGLAVSLLAWLAIHWLLPPSNPLVALALKQNSQAFMNPGREFCSTLPCLAVICLGGLLLLSVLRTDIQRRLALCVIGVVLLVAFVRAWHFDIVEHRYTARVAIVWVAPVLSLLPLRMPACRQAGYALLVSTSLMLAAIHLKSVHDWTQYRDAFIAQVQGRPPQPAEPVAHERAANLAVRFRWPWVYPYQAAVLTERGSRATLPLDETGWFVPLTCAMVRQPTLQMQTLLTPAELERLGQDVCDKFQRHR